MNKCYCDNGFGGPDCSLTVEITEPPPTQVDAMPTMSSAEKAKSNLESKMEKKETPYGKIIWPEQNPLRVLLTQMTQI